MAAFFSGTDDNAIKQEGMNCNHFLSLVVNNAGKYVARVTKRNVIKQSIHQIISEESCYPTYEDKLICNTEIKEDTKDFVKETAEIIAYPLNIEVEKWEEDKVEEWEADIKEAQEASRQEVRLISSVHHNFNNAVQYKVEEAADANSAMMPPPSIQTPAPHFHQAYQQYLFNDYDFDQDGRYKIAKQNPDGSEDEVDSETVIKTMYKQSDINYLTIQILAGCPFITKDKVNLLPQYSVKLPTIVKQRFDKLDHYHTFIDGFIDAILEETASAKCDIPDLMDEFTSVIAQEIIDKLETLPKNNIIKYLTNQLTSYLI